MSTCTYRVTLEVLDDNGTVIEQHMFAQEGDERDNGSSLGIALAGIVHAVCAYDEPVPTEILGALLRRGSCEETTLFHALGEVIQWYCESGYVLGDLNDLAAVVVHEKAKTDRIFIFAMPVDTLPTKEAR